MAPLHLVSPRAPLSCLPGAAKREAKGRDWLGRVGASGPLSRHASGRTAPRQRPRSGGLQTEGSRPRPASNKSTAGLTAPWLWIAEAPGARQALTIHGEAE